MLAYDNKSRHILIYIDVMERYRFFIRFLKPIEALGYQVSIITNKLLIYLILRLKGYSVYLLKRSNVAIKQNIRRNLQYSLSVLTHYHSYDEARRIYSNTYYFCEAIHQKVPISDLFIFNGTTTIASAVGDFAKEYNLRSYFFEISNLGAKIFVDKEGVNAKSYLFNHPQILDGVAVDEEAYQTWRKAWMANYTLPPQKANTTKLPLSFLIDWIGFTLFFAIREDQRSIVKVLRKKFLLKKRNSYTTAIDLLPKRFIFLALQVTDDSQLVLNSDVDNLQALTYAKELAYKYKYDLVVKLHPAEADTTFIEQIENMSKNGDFILTDALTHLLIERSQKVVVINSTVGLESKILQKDVEVLGRAFYQSFDQKRVRAYIMDYLIDIDYFDTNASVDTKELKRIFAKHA